MLKDFGANICVVGDDDQTIYQFRGSDTKNILTFKERYNIQKNLFLDTNYRSTEGIVDVARRVILYNDNRLAKAMHSGCLVQYDIGDIAYAEYRESEEEFDFIANRIVKLHSVGVPYSEMAVLLRKRKISSVIAEKLEEYHIPFVVEGVNDLFGMKECQAAKGIYDYLNGELSSTDLFKAWLDIEYPLDKKELADAVNIMTVHQSKGLEFAAVFIPQLNKNYFPTQRIGGKGIWHILNRSWITDSARFDGDVEEERKLFWLHGQRSICICQGRKQAGISMYRLFCWRQRILLIW